MNAIKNSRMLGTWFNSDYQRLQSILSRCVREIPDPRGFDYKVYLVGSDELNAFTVGGYIFFYQGMLDFVENDDELAAIMGHEIFHNELGHVRQNLSEIKTIRELNPFGDFFEEVLLGVNQLLSSPFNQKQETECDLHGIDLMMAAGYNGCASATLWERMAEYGEDWGVFNVISSTPTVETAKIVVKTILSRTTLAIHAIDKIGKFLGKDCSLHPFNALCIWGSCRVYLFPIHLLSVFKDLALMERTASG